MFKKNTAVTGFAFALVSSTDGSAITSGTVTGYYTLDGGTQGTITGSPVHEGNGQWTVNLLAAEMNGDIVGLLFTHTSAINASFTIKTETKLVSDLNDAAAAPTAAAIRTEMDSSSTQLSGIKSVTDALPNAGALTSIATATALAAVDTVANGIQTDLSNATDGLGAIKTAVDAIPTSNPSAASIADAVLDEALSGHVTAGTLGKAVSDIESDATAILADTNELQGDWTDGGRLDLIIDAILSDIGTDGVVLTAAERNAIADAILDRNMATGTDSGSPSVRTVRQALRFSRNKVSISGGTLTVTKEDDTTASWTASVTTTAGDPITTVDPA